MNYNHIPEISGFNETDYQTIQGSFCNRSDNVVYRPILFRCGECSDKSKNVISEIIPEERLMETKIVECGGCKTKYTVQLNSEKKKIMIKPLNTDNFWEHRRIRN